MELEAQNSGNAWLEINLSESYLDWFPLYCQCMNSQINFL
jgi:hypothetical protein